MDEPSSKSVIGNICPCSRVSLQLEGEHAAFASRLFDGRGRLHRQFGTAGTGCWGKEVNGDSLTYLEEIKIDPAWQGKGVGTWALRKLGRQASSL